VQVHAHPVLDAQAVPRGRDASTLTGIQAGLGALLGHGAAVLALDGVLLYLAVTGLATPAPAGGLTAAPVDRGRGLDQ
jgi:hypothetical protein